MIHNYHQILGVSLTANKEEIKKAYRKKAKLYHPDLNSSPQSKEQFQQLLTAYHTLLKHPVNTTPLPQRPKTASIPKYQSPPKEPVSEPQYSPGFEAFLKQQRQLAQLLYIVLLCLLCSPILFILLIVTDVPLNTSYIRSFVVGYLGLAFIIYLVGRTRETRGYKKFTSS